MAGMLCVESVGGSLFFMGFFFLGVEGRGGRGWRVERGGSGGKEWKGGVIRMLFV
jgi:hypothetical protein